MAHGGGIRRHPRIAAIIALILAILGDCACSRARTDYVYRIGLGPWVGFGPFYLAKDKNFFRDAGINVDLIVLTGLAERNSALKSGRIDGLAAPVDYFVLSAGNNLVTKIVAAVDESVGGDGIVANRAIHTFPDLRGRRVAFQRGLPSEFFLRVLLQENHMKLSELKAVDMETAQAGAAFIAKQLDAAGLWEPWLTRAKEEGHGHVLASTRDQKNLIVDCLAFNTAIADQRSGDVQKIVNALFQAIDYWKNNRDEANRMMAPYFQVDPQKYAVLLSGAQFADSRRNREYFGRPGAPGPIFDVAKRASEVWQDAGVMQTPVDPDKIISTQFVSASK